MRPLLYCLLTTVCLSAAGLTQTLPSPAACADYAANQTGGDAPCDAAIVQESDPAVKSVLLFRRAYMEDALGDFATYPKALADLDEAIRLLPGNFMALHERAYLYNEYGRWADALKDIDAQIVLRPQLYDGYQERALSRFHLGDLQGAYDDRNTVAMLDPGKPGHLLGRAAAALWLGNFEAAGKDLDAAAKLSPGNDDKNELARLRTILALLGKISGKEPAAKACSEADKDGDFMRKDLAGDCTRAFLDAKTAQDKADALTIRAMALALATQDQANALDDHMMAAVLAPQDWGKHSNLGFAYMNARHSRAALEEFDKSVALKEDFFNLAGRAAVKYNLHDLDGAEADSRRSNEIKANGLALTVLGDCAYDRTKTYDKAKDYWLAAYRLGDRNDSLIARLKDAGVPIPPPEDKAENPAK